MGASGDVPSIEVLLSHQRWVGRLARSLVADEAQADDLVQDAWLAALESPPRHGAAPRAWLAKVLSNLRRMRRRSEGARGQRERLAADERPGASLDQPAEIVGRAETQHRLVADVLALAEPYRSTLLLRYFDELSAEEIARRQGLSGSTVRNRVKRGLELLRDRLERRFGEEPGGWMRALLLIVPPPEAALTATSAGATTGWLAMGQGVKLAAAAVGTVAAGAWLWYGLGWPDGGRAAPEGRVSSADAELLAAAPGDEPPASLASASGEAAASQRSAVSGGLEPTLTGIVVSLDGGGPVAGTRIDVVPYRGRAAGEEHATSSGADGRFSLPLPGAESAVRFQAQGFMARRVFPDQFLVAADEELRVTLAPLGSLAVQVLDQDGGPAAQVAVQVFSRQTYDGDPAWSWIDDVHREGVTDDAGRCVLADLPCGTTLSVHAGSGGASQQFTQIDPALRRGTVTLGRQARGQVVGRVEEQGHPPAVPLELVLESAPGWGLAGLHSWTDGEGRYRFDEVPPGAVKLRVPGMSLAPVEGTVAPGGTLEFETLTIAGLATFSGRVRSRFGLMPGTVAVDLLREGRRLTETLWAEPERGRPASEGLLFEARIAPGPVTVRVSQHDASFLMDGQASSGRVVSNFELGELLREEYSAPGQDLVLSVDAAVGAVELELERGTPEDSVALQLRPLASAGGGSDVFTGLMQEISAGTFRSYGFPSGRYSVGVSGPGGTAWFPEVWLPPDGIADLGQLAWASGAIGGRVTHGEGTAVPGALLTLRSITQDNERRDAATDERGTYRFDGLPAGLYELLASHPEVGTSQPALVELTGGERTQDLELGGLGTIELLVLQAGRPAVDVEVGLGVPAEEHVTLKRMERTDAAGVARYEGLAPGPYALFPPQGQLSVLLAADETKRATWEVGQRTQEVLLVQGGSPLARLDSCELLVVEPESELCGRHYYVVHKAQEGRVFLPAIPGRCALLLNLRGFEAEERWVQLVDGRGGRFPDVVDVSPAEVRIDVAAGFEAPRLRLRGLAGICLGAGPALGELQREPSPEGAWIYRGIPQGAVLELRGLGRDGKPVKQEFVWGSAPPLPMTWP